MKQDLTLLYYTASIIEEYLADNVRKHLLEVTGKKFPIVSVSQKPLEFGDNICMGTIGQSYYNCYKQVLVGARKVKTKFVAMCEDDTLYSMEHFTHRPKGKAISYNRNMWYAEDIAYWYRGWVGMCTGIVETNYLLKYLETRYKMYPEESKIQNQKDFQELGVCDDKFGLSNAKREIFETKIPIVTFNFSKSLGGKKWSWAHPPIIKKGLEFYGNAYDLKKKFWGKARKSTKFLPLYG